MKNLAGYFIGNSWQLLINYYPSCHELSSAKINNSPSASVINASIDQTIAL